MTDDKKPDPIPVLWFDAKGCGPDEMALQLNPLDALMDGPDLVAPPTLGLMVRAGEIVILGRAMVDGGFQMAREQVADLHRQIGEWLAVQYDHDQHAEIAAMEDFARVDTHRGGR